ncbi:MAG: hypothetical protein WB621_25535, partial [Candidatus Acidiferrales bacterium]
MRRNPHPQAHFRALVTTLLLIFAPCGLRAQSVASPPAADSTPDLKTLAEIVRQLQSQVQTLNSQVNELRAGQREALVEAAALRSELNRAREQMAARTGEGSSSYGFSSAPSVAASADPRIAPTPQNSGASLAEQLSQLEDDERLLNDKVVEQSQTKVESGSKYRVRLS